MRFRALTPHYQRYSYITNQSDCQPSILFTPLCLVCQQLLLETDWLSQVPTLTVRLPATDLDPGTFPCSHHCEHFFSGFREMKPLAFVLHRLFRGSIPSLALWLTSSFTPALCSLLPFYTQSLVLNWWLAFVQAGLSSLLMTAFPGALITIPPDKVTLFTGGLASLLNYRLYTTSLSSALWFI